MGFLYCFDMSQEIAHFKSMPEYIQQSSECSVVDVIYESFVVPGDQDYVTSRLLAYNGLPRGFYWAAAQAIEKYLKAFLLMNGEGVRKFNGHSVKNLWIASTKVDILLGDLCVLPHPKIQATLSTPAHLRTFSISDLIAELEKHGTADNRYNAFGVEFNTGHLWAMDSLAFKLRQKIGALSIEQSLTPLGHDMLQAFKKCNPWFHGNDAVPASPSEDNPITHSSSVTKLEILRNNQSNPAYKIAHQWLSEKMKLPK
jgi:hypothetical protein